MPIQTSRMIEQAVDRGHRSGTLDAVCVAARMSPAQELPIGPEFLAAVEAAGGLVVRCSGDLCLTLVSHESDAPDDEALRIGSLFCRQLGAAVGLSRGEIAWHAFGPAHLTRVAFLGTPLRRAREIAEDAPSGSLIWDSPGEQLGPTREPATGDSEERRAPTYPTARLALCAVRLGSAQELRVASSDIAHLVEEMDGTFDGLDFSTTEGRLRVVFGATRELSQPERRAADFAIALRQRYPSALRASVDAGSLVAGPRGEGLFAGYVTVGEAASRSEHALELCEAGQIVVGPGVNDALAPTYALQPLSREARRRHRVRADVKLLLWRERAGGDADLFVGREREIEQLRDYVREGKEESVLVAGPPGIGKSTLVRRILVGRPASSILFVPGSDRPQAPFACMVDGLSAYWELPIPESPAFVRSLLGRLDELGDRHWDEELKAEFLRLRPFVSFSFGVDDPVVASLDPETRHQNAHDGWILLLRSLDQLRVVWIDDHQWLDLASREVIEEWVGRPDSSQLRVIATTRAAAERASRAGATGRRIRTIGLGGLPSEATRAYLEQRRVASLLEPADLEALIDRCAGNPFFLDQACRYVREEAATLEPGRRVSDVPGSVEQIILARIERLSAGVRRAVEMASILGHRFDTRVLSAMLREEALPEGLQPAAGEGIWESAGELTSIFSHSLVRETVYESQLQREQRDLHAAAAQAIEAVYSGAARRPHLYEIAEHYEIAGSIEEALHYLAEAARFALENYENERAVSLLRRRKRLTADADVAADHDLASALVRTGGWDEALAILENAIDRFAASPAMVAAHDAVDCFFAYSDLLIERGSTDLALEYAHRGIAVAETNDYPRGLALLFRCVGLAAYAREAYGEALEAYEEGLGHAGRANDDEATARLKNNVAVVYAKVGRYDEALEAFRSNLERARRVNAFRGVSAALNNIGFLYNEMERHREAMPYFEEDLALCTTAGDRQGQSIAIGNIASILASLGRHEEAVARYRESIEIDGRIGFLPHKAYNHQKLGSSLIALGLESEGCSEFAEAFSIAERIDFPMVRDQAADLLEGCADR